MRRFPILLCAMLAAPAAARAQPEDRAADLVHWPKAARARQCARERDLIGRVDPERIARTHEKLASRPHAAGTEGDAVAATDATDDADRRPEPGPTDDLD